MVYYEIGYCLPPTTIIDWNPDPNELDFEGNYLSVSELAASKYDGETIDLSAYCGEEIYAAIQLAESTVENITGNIFYAKPEVNSFDGRRYRLFFQPKVPYPLLTINSVVDQDIYGTTVTTYEENVDFVNYGGYIELSGKYPVNSRRQSCSAGVWPSGQKNIVVDGVWGMETTPPEIKEAVRILAAETLVPGFYQLPPNGIIDAQWDDFEVQYATPLQKGQATGFDKVDNYLQPFINYSTTFQFIP